MKKILILATLLAFLSVGILPLFSEALSGREILRRMQRNEIYKSMRSEGSWIIKDRFGTRKKTFKVYSLGTEKTLIVFTNPEEEGQKILRVGNEIYLYFPDAEEVIRIEGSAMRDSVLGSDFSYEDMTGQKDLLDSYDVRLEGEDTIEGKSYYKLRLKAKRPDVVYPMEELWVDKKNYALKRAYYYALSGRKIKELDIGEVSMIKGRAVPVHFLMRDLLKKDSQTEFIISKIEIDVHVDEKLFSLEELSW